MTTPDTRDPVRREGMPPWGAMTLEHLRLYGAGLCTEETFGLMMDVIDAAHAECAVCLEAALDRLAAHLAGASGEERL